MKFRWWYVSMGATAVLVLVVMVYFGTFLCVPVEDLPCASLWNVAREINGSNSTIAPIPSHVVPITNSSIIPLGTGGTAQPNGKKIDFTLSFHISPDFSKYGFNAPIDSPGANPDIKVHAGDTVTIHLSNPSKSLHAFGVVINPESPSAVLWESAYKTADNPMKPGESGDVTFVAGSPGLYHYICTVPGHAELGMNGRFIVEQ